MNIKYLILIFVFAIISSSELYAQNQLTEKSENSKNDFTASEWQKIQIRWEKFQPVVDLITKNGDTISGQVVFSNEKKIIVYPGSEVLLTSQQAAEMININLTEIDRIHIQKGGYASKGVVIGAILGGGAGTFGGLILAAGWSIIPTIALGTVGFAGGAWIGSKVQNMSRSSDLDLRQYSSEYTEELRKISKSAVFVDSISFPIDIHQAIHSSQAIRRTFPDKLLRISFAMSTGPNAIKNDLTKMLESTSLPDIIEYRPGPFAFEFLDVSWRFSDRYIIGAQMHLNRDSYAYIYSYDYSSPANVGYHYDIFAVEGRYYFDYVLNPVNRFFTKPYEFLIGAGVIFGVRSANFTYDYVPDLVTGNLEFLEFLNTPKIQGLQIRSAVHIYPFPGFSLFAGLEGNLYNSITIASIVLPTNDPIVSIEVPEHKFQFSTLRIKVGASFYF